jgi:pantoate--beta-alanine ligase
MQLTVTHDMENLQATLSEFARLGMRVALVPTMGALHEGHAALIRHATTLADVVVVSIFVNPKQFGANEDFSKYPKTLNSDIKVVDEADGVLIYAPPADDLYPEGYATTVSVAGLTDRLCGLSRPGHFDGVATVVTKLLLRVLPHVAVFGEKDYQQLCVIRRLVEDLDIGVPIEGLPTVREPSGLALSSRNAYLSEAERKVAPMLFAVLHSTAERMRGGMASAEALAEGRQELAAAGFAVEYLELCDAYSLAPLVDYQVGARLLVAAKLGTTRLIDNIEVD